MLYERGATPVRSRRRVVRRVVRAFGAARAWSEEKGRRVNASFDSQVLIASLAELEKCAGEHTPSTRLSEVPSAQLGIDLAAILASVKSRSAPQAAAVDDVARLADVPPDQAAASDSATIDQAPDKDLRRASGGKNSASSRPHRWIYAPAAIVIVMGSLVGGTGYLAGVKVLAALQALRAPREFDPPSQTTAQAPAVEQTADAEPATPAAAEQTASSAAPVAEIPPAPEASPVASGAKASAEQPAEADAMTPPALVAQPAAAVTPTPLAAAATPPTPAKTLAAVNYSALAGASSKPKARVAETTQPVKERKKPSADKSEKHEPRSNRNAKSKPARVAKPHGAPGATAPPAVANAEPDVVSDARRAAQEITGALKGWVDVDSRALR